MNTIDPKNRLKQIFETTIDSGLKYSGDINEIDFYSLICTSTANNNLYRIINCNVVMFNCEYKNEESILMIFSIPLTLNDDTKHISERIIDVLKLVEDCFITVDFMDLKNVKEDKFYYMIVIKNIKEVEENF